MVGFQQGLGYLRWMERISSTEVWKLRLWDEMVMAWWMGKRERDNVGDRRG